MVDASNGLEQQIDRAASACNPGGGRGRPRDLIVVPVKGARAQSTRSLHGSESEVVATGELVGVTLKLCLPLEKELGQLCGV